MVSNVMTEIQTNVNSLCSRRRDISLGMILRHSISLKDECNEIHVLKYPGNLPEINSIENVWNIMKKETGNQLPCLKEEI